MSRWIKFFIALAIGVGIGLYYAWIANPVQVVDTTPDSLRIDYRTDYILMVAEIYQMERDPARAARRLAQLGDDPPAQIAQQGVIYAEQAGYSELDINLLAQLRDALQTWNPGPGEISP